MTRPALLLTALVACATTTPMPSDPHGHPAPGHDAHGAHPGPGHVHGAHRFEDPAEWAPRLEDPERDAWQRPDALVASLGLAPGARVADVGAGTGYLTLRLARAVPEGRVFAVDVEPKMVAYVEERAKAAGLVNVQGVVAAFDDPRLAGPVDLVLVVDTIHHVEDRVAWFGRLRPALASGARLVIVDFKTGDQPVGPPPEMKLAPEVLAKELDAAGFREVSRDETGYPYQYVSTFVVR